MQHFLITDDDIFSSGGMAQSLKAFYPGCVVHEVRSVRGALLELARNREIRLVLLDLNVDDSRGIETLKTVKQWCEDNDFNPRIVVVSAAADYDDSLIAESIDHCATGFITKGISVEVFHSAIEMTLAGSVFIPERYLNRQHAPKAGSNPQGDLSFTAREAQVAALLIQGLSYKQIARKLENEEAGRAMSENTVRVHVQRIAWKLRLTEPPGGARLSAKSAVITAFAERRLSFVA